MISENAIIIQFPDGKEVKWKELTEQERAVISAQLHQQIMVAVAYKERIKQEKK